MAVPNSLNLLDSLGDERRQLYVVSANCRTQN